MSRIFGLALVAYLAALASAIPLPALADTPVTLSGESLGVYDVQITNVHCNIKKTSTFDFHASGEATGPYPGTFEEWGTVEIGPQTHGTVGPDTPFPDAAWQSIRAAFTITSGPNRVKGVKTLVDTTYNFPYNEAVCAKFPNRAAPDVSKGYAWGGTSDRLEYRAQISGPSGSRSDQGQAYLALGDFDYVWNGNQQGPDRSFFEEFTSSSS